jgi:hypothetical protein
MLKYIKQWWGLQKIQAPRNILIIQAIVDSSLETLLHGLMTGYLLQQEKSLNTTQCKTFVILTYLLQVYIPKLHVIQIHTVANFLRMTQPSYKTHLCICGYHGGHYMEYLLRCDATHSRTCKRFGVAYYLYPLNISSMGSRFLRNASKFSSIRIPSIKAW